MNKLAAFGLAAFAAAALIASPAEAKKKPTHRPTHVAMCPLAMSPGKSGRLVSDATRTFYDFQDKIPQSILRSAKGIIIVPSLVKVGFIIGGQGGDAVLLRRIGKVWTYPAFYSLGSPSIGLQAGISSAQIVLVLMTDRAVDAVRQERFRLGTEAGLAIFMAGGNDGASPQVALVSATDGNLYGVASSGGTNHNGTLFRMTPAGQFTALYSFSADNSGTNADGINPAALIQASDGNLYGVASFGGQSGAGTIFKATLAGAVTPLYSFGATSTDTHTNTDGSSPSGIIQGRDGNFYGTTLNGGPGALGTIFTFTGPGTAFQFVTPGGIQYANGHATLTLSGLAAQGPVIIDASTDLTHWSPILTNPPASGQIQLTDPAAGSFAYRFYRARLIEP